MNWFMAGLTLLVLFGVSALSYTAGAGRGQVDTGPLMALVFMGSVAFSLFNGATGEDI